MNPDTADKGYVVPSEGTLFWLDTWVMLADAPHPNAAVRLARLHPAPGDPGRGDQLQPATRRRTTRPSSSSSRRCSTTRRSSRPRTSSPTSKAPQDTSGNAAAHRHLGGVQVEASAADADRRPADDDDGDAAHRRPSRRSRSASRLRSGLLTTVLLLPAGLWYLVLLVLPLAIVVVFSFGDAGQERRLRARRSSSTTTPGPSRSSSRSSRASRWPSPGRSAACSSGCRSRTSSRPAPARHKGLFILLLVVPFWTSFLIRTYAWLIILGPGTWAGGQLESLTGDRTVQILGTPFAVMLGLVYGYLPLMVFPLYVTLERMDRTLVEASKDLGAGRWATFRQITLPIALPGLVTGSILVFIPMMGEYVIPQILGYGRTYLMGNALVIDFLEARNWPSGSARAVFLILDHDRHDPGLPVVREPRPAGPVR